MEERKGFGTTFGFLMAAVGSAVGLGNIWGFPNKMGANGGFTFLVIYLILAALCGFIKGVIAGNHDNEYVYIDGVMRIAGKPVNELAAFFYMLDKVAAENSLTITVSISAAKEELPDFVQKYL